MSGMTFGDALVLGYVLFGNGGGGGGGGGQRCPRGEFVGWNVIDDSFTWESTAELKE